MVNANEIAATLMSVGQIVLWVVVIGAVVGGIIYLIKRQMVARQYKVIILGRDSFGQVVAKHDFAGIYVDRKTKNKRFFVQKAKVGLNPDKIPYIPMGKKKVVYLVQTGLKNFHFLKLNYKEPTITTTVGEEDVNWGINSYESAKKAFSNDLWSKYMPYIGLFFVGIVMIIFFFQIFKNIAALESLIEASTELARALASANSGTTVIPS